MLALLDRDRRRSRAHRDRRRPPNPYVLRPLPRRGAPVRRRRDVRGRASGPRRPSSRSTASRRRSTSAGTPCSPRAAATASTSFRSGRPERCPRSRRPTMRAPVVDGRAPDPSAPLEVALSERTARRLGVGVGDPAARVTLQRRRRRVLGDDAEPDGPALALDVVGIVRTPGDVASREADIEPNFLTPAFAETYGDEIGPFGDGIARRARAGSLGGRGGTRWWPAAPAVDLRDVLRRRRVPRPGRAHPRRPWRPGLRIVALDRRARRAGSSSARRSPERPADRLGRPRRASERSGRTRAALLHAAQPAERARPPAVGIARRRRC